MKLDIIGDIHGCFDELTALVKKLGYSWDDGIPVHPGRKLAFIGILPTGGRNPSIRSNLWQHYAPGGKQGMYRGITAINCTAISWAMMFKSAMDLRQR